MLRTGQSATGRALRGRAPSWSHCDPLTAFTQVPTNRYGTCYGTAAARIPHRYPMSNTSSAESQPQVASQRAPRIWSTTLMFVVTFVAALVLVPWFGLTHGFSAGAWILFVVFLYANGMSITGGYHRLWAHKSYDAHWSLRLIYLVFGTMALQNSVFIWASGHRTHHLNVDDVEEDPYSITRGFWFAHIGWMVREYESGKPNLTNIPDLRRDPMLAFQHRFYVPLALLTNFGLPLLAGWLIGDVWGTFILAGVLRLVVSHHVTFFIKLCSHPCSARLSGSDAIYPIPRGGMPDRNH